LSIKPLETELINLERNNMTGKIDHNSENTKDISDSLAGALFNASKYDDVSALHATDDYLEVINVNQVETSPAGNIEKSLSNIIADKAEDSVQNKLSDLSSLVGSVVAEQEEEQKRIEAERLKKLRSRLTATENSMVSDRELNEAYDSSDDMLIF
jgi:hypothetical protein